ncbi:hypothetical protein ETAA8_67310 [Anatilimnocola aggregata]|uniref:Cytochrome c domain-containing protein n=1 Tax=Anatilimnocola aggregata TaxID=2528021 RepID=A0A517YMY2_9BACT|nr:c-type cytochrome [Anatilimnocola aggregata]QDU31572.1 hypothetical protein ETAA8_67310 [Anatilimnocola aggregata]
MRLILLCSLLIASCGLVNLSPSVTLAAEPPHWIWSSVDQPDKPVFTRRLHLTSPFQTAQLQFAADFCQATVEINGQAVLSVAPYCQTQSLDVTRWLQRGENELVIRALPVEGPSAVALSLAVQQQNETTYLITDKEWQATDLGAVLPELWGTGRRSIALSPFENYEQWQQAKTDSPHKAAPKFWTVPGFEIQELRAARPDEGSWISCVFDSQGKLLISREDQGLLRMTLAADRQSIANVEPIPSTLKEIRGLVRVGDDLVANANNSKGMYRFQIAADETVQAETELRQFPGNVGHGRNDLVVATLDGKQVIYSIQGDSVDVPRENIRDYTSPLTESKRKEQKREGFLLRTAPPGKNWELLSAGLRNPYGIDLDQKGEPFTFDADNEFDMGMPWYRPTRILHLLTGGDHGYRESTGKFPPRFHDQPDHTPPVIDIGRSSPTSVMFGYQLKFPQPYRQALFALDWTYGRVIVVHLAPRGATWRAATELFLQGRPLNVTDVTAGSDGDMYLITGGRKTQSALYRVRFVGKQANAAIELGAHEEEARKFSHEQRQKFASLLHPDKASPAGAPRDVVAPPEMASADPLVRQAARLAYETHYFDPNGKPIRTPETLPDLLAAARTRRPDDVPRILERVKLWKWQESDLSSQFIWVRIVQLCHETSPDAVESRKVDLLSPLLVLCRELEASTTKEVAPEGTSDELRRRVALLMGELGSKSLPAFAARTLLNSSVQEDQLAGLLALRNAREGWTPETRRSELVALNNVSRMVGGAGLPPFEKWLRPQILATLSEEENKAFADLLEPQPVTVEPLPPPRKHLQKWTLPELVSVYEDDASLGDAKLGAVIFRDALCVRCHRVGLRGAAVGPELTQVSRRFSRRDMLESILSPNLSVAENYRMETILTEDGKVHSGRVVAEGDYRSEKLVLNTDPLRPELIIEIDKKQITDHRATQTSPMPSGLLDSFTRDEIRHLLAYLLAGQ